MFKLIRLFVLSIILNFCNSGNLSAEELKKLRIGSLQYGSVNWELKLIKELKLDNTNNFDLEIVELASKNAAEIYSMPIIQEEIENDPNNVTRFLIFSKQQTEPTTNDKTSIIFSINHEPGTLYEIIKEFSNNDINLTKIESRPKKGATWEYNFYLDFVGHISDPKISSMLDSLKKNTKFLKIIGSYPLAELS